MTETITVAIPLDGSVPPCPHCGSITVDLDGNPQPCAIAECPGKCRAPHPNPPYRCIGYDREGREVDETAKHWTCFKSNGHDGPHRSNGYNFEISP